MKKELFCQKCGGKCKNTEKIFEGQCELGFKIPAEIYKCEQCGQEHIICSECGGDKFKINYKSHSIFEDVNDCPECLGLGSILING